MLDDLNAEEQTAIPANAMSISRPASRWIEIILCLLESVLLLSLFWTLGEAAKYAVQIFMGTFILWFGGLSLILAVGVGVVHSRVVRRRSRWHIPLVLAFLGLWIVSIGSQAERIVDARSFLHDRTDDAVWVYRDTVIHSNHISPWHVKVDACGFRNQEETVLSTPRPRVVTLGDSYMFCPGVEDAEAITPVLQATLAENGFPAVVRNAAVHGTALVSHPRTLRHAMDCYDPDLVLLYLNPGDSEFRFDTMTRLDKLRDDVWPRVVAALNLDVFQIVAERIWMKVLMPDPMHETKVAEAMNRDLDAILRLVGTADLLIVTNLHWEEWQPVAEWIGRHPEVNWLDVTRDPAWHAVETLGIDPHWSPRGIEQIAEFLAPRVAAVLQSDKQPAIRHEPDWVALRQAHAPRARTNADTGQAAPKAVELTSLEAQVEGLRIEEKEGGGMIILPAFDGEPPVEISAYWCNQERYYKRIGEVCFAIRTVPLSPNQERRVTEFFEATQGFFGSQHLSYPEKTD